MITEILLGLTAMLLGLFCLLYRRGERRDIHFADAGEMLALLKNRHAVFQTVLGALVLASAASAGDLLAQYVHAPAGMLSVLHLCRLLLGGVFFLSFAFYAVKLLSFERSPSRSVRAAALLPTVLAVLGAAVQIVFSVPYIDASTGAMCFTVSTTLPSGKGVVGMDLNFSKAQESILRMTRGREQTAMIVTSGGLIAGYTDMSLVGERAEEKLPEYADILRRVTASQEHGSFRVELDGHPSMIFSSETSNNWYLILSVDTSTLYAESYRQIAMLASVNLLMLAMVFVFYVTSARSSRQAARTLAESGSFLDGFAGRLRETAAHILRLGDARLLREGEDPTVLAGQVRGAGQQVSGLAADLGAYSGVLRRRAEEEETLRKKPLASAVEAPSRRVRNGIIIALLISLVIVLIFCININMNWGNTRMSREADTYENQLNEWLTQQQSILHMFTDMISAQPELMADYDSAVQWLNDIAQHYPEISACYMANPYAERPVIMNTGWEPGEDDRPETRPWYRATERSADGFSISAPYPDVQTDTYCITLSRVVYGGKGEFLGIFGIDFFLDKLIHVLGESYTSNGYAFLVDSDGVIINRPNEAYQMSEDNSVSVEDTEYAEAYNRTGVTVLRDHTARLMACLSRKTGSGFTVLVVNRWWNMYGSVVVVTMIFLALFGICLLYIVSLINRLIRWQADVNRQLVEAAEAVVNAGQAKSQFLAQMSHEIRTPMNAIIGLDNIALRDPDLSPDIRDNLTKIGASARHLLALINDILDMSRIESGRLELREASFSFRELLLRQLYIRKLPLTRYCRSNNCHAFRLPRKGREKRHFNHLINAALQSSVYGHFIAALIMTQINVIVNSQCEDKGLRYVCNTVGKVDSSFVGDDLKLKQVLINILGNSVKFTEAPGVVTFTVEQTETRDDTCVLRFTIEDTGVGMDKEFIPKLFEAFSQEDSSLTNRYGGSGLGMAITRNIVEMMGGEIAVESEKGLGTTFIVTVTLGRAAEETPVIDEAEPLPEPEQPVSVVGRHLLIAEDNELNAEILSDLLNMEGISSEWAENSKLAVEFFAESEAGHFDGVLMDMRMPVMDGLTATRELRKLDHPDAARVPVIALTANAFEEDVRQCLEAGMDAHLSKPVDIDVLKETLARLIAARTDAETR